MISTLHTFLQMDDRYFVNERTHEKILAIQNRLNGKECIQYEGNLAQFLLQYFTG